MRIVTNRCYGEYNLSHKAVMEYAKRKGIALHPSQDPRLFSGLEYNYYRVPIEEYRRLHEAKDTKAINEVYFSVRDIPRDDPVLVSVVEDLGEEASGRCSDLWITEIPHGVAWVIKERNGMEWVSEISRIW